MTAAIRPKAVYIAQGEQATGGGEDDVIATTLGSCVAVCLWDPTLRRGGMNHILLPDLDTDWPWLQNIGATAMDKLVNALLKEGALKSRLRAKVFGGSAMIAGLTNIGERNAAFVLDYLNRERIPIDGQSTGGTVARQVRFWPMTGLAKQKFVTLEREEAPPKRYPANGVELF